MISPGAPGIVGLGRRHFPAELACPANDNEFGQPTERSYWPMARDLRQTVDLAHTHLAFYSQWGQVGAIANERNPCRVGNSGKDEIKG